MNKFGVFAITSVLFGGGGFALGYFIARKKYFDLADKEVESMKAKQKEHDEWLLKKHGVKKETMPKPNSSSMITPNTIKPGEDRLEKENKAAESEYVNYSKLAGKYSGKEESQQPVHDDNIYIITGIEFNESDYSYETLRYYPDEGIVTDLEGNPISAFQSLVGPINLWSKSFNDNKTVYVRNRSMKMDYEILETTNVTWSETASEVQKDNVISVGETDDDE